MAYLPRRRGNLYQFPLKNVSPDVPLKINDSSPFTRNLKAAVLPKSSGNEDLVGLWGVAKRGQEVRTFKGMRVLDLEGASLTSDDCGWRLTPPSGTMPAVMDGGFTFCCHVRTDSYWDTDGRLTLLDSRNSGAPNQGYLFFMEDSTETDGLVMQVDIGASVQTVVSESNIVKLGEYQTFVASFDAVNGRGIVAVDGQLVGNSTFSTGNHQDDNGFIPILRRGEAGGTSLDNFRGDGAFWTFSDRAFSETECIQVSADIYGSFLEPVVEDAWFIPTGAPPAGRIMSSLVWHGGLANSGGIAGSGGGLAG